jgi:hypothetical protein
MSIQRPTKPKAPPRLEPVVPVALQDILPSMPQTFRSKISTRCPHPHLLREKWPVPAFIDINHIKNVTKEFTSAFLLILQLHIPRKRSQIHRHDKTSISFPDTSLDMKLQQQILIKIIHQ